MLDLSWDRLETLPPPNQQGASRSLEKPWPRGRESCCPWRPSWRLLAQLPQLRDPFLGVLKNATVAATQEGHYWGEGVQGSPRWTDGVLSVAGRREQGSGWASGLYGPWGPG